jgi:hypothetical protein
VWSPSAWRRCLAANPPEDTWLALLAAAEADEEEREPDDDYPVEWLAVDWLQAPDRVDFLEETTPPLVPNPNTAAGDSEHLATLGRNALERSSLWVTPTCALLDGGSLRVCLRICCSA